MKIFLDALAYGNADILPTGPAPRVSDTPGLSLITQWIDLLSSESLAIFPAQLSLDCVPIPIQPDPVQPDPTDTQAHASDACNRILDASGALPSLLIEDLKQQGTPIWSTIIAEVPHLVYRYVFTKLLGWELSSSTFDTIIEDALWQLVPPIQSPPGRQTWHEVQDEMMDQAAHGEGTGNDKGEGQKTLAKTARVIEDTPSDVQQYINLLTNQKVSQKEFLNVMKMCFKGKEEKLEDEESVGEPKINQKNGNSF
ncbi:hypothetical protein BU15DRAFT_75348 [Melanogaster broomeanus]|nr:hypothetical protein BU15DRAFT_75348 [Melanogaster broomeanus]